MDKLWNTPTKYRINKKPASLLELFFDVVVVAVIGASINSIIDILDDVAKHNHVFSLRNSESIVFTVLQTLSVIFMWRIFTLYSSKYEQTDIRHRTIVFLLMLSISLMVIADYLDFVKNTRSIIIINAVGVFSASIILAYIHWSAANWTFNKYEKKSLNIIAIGRLTHLFLTIMSGLFIVIPKSLDFYWYMVSVWVFSLIVWVIFDYLAMSNKHHANSHSLLKSHIQERFSILFIVFVGEMFAHTIFTISKNFNYNLSITKEVIMLVLTFTISFSIWLIFNELYRTPDLINHPHAIFYYTYSMVGVLFSLIGTTIGITLTLEGHDTSRYGEWGLYFGTALWFFMQGWATSSLRPYKIKSNFAWSRTIRWTNKYSFLIWMVAFFWVIWVPGVNEKIMFYLVFSTSTIFLFYIQIEKHMGKKPIGEINEELIKLKSISDKKDKVWIKKYIVPNLDIEWHKENEFKLNRYSKIAKKIYDKQ